MNNVLIRLKVFINVNTLFNIAEYSKQNLLNDIIEVSILNIGFVSSKSTCIIL